jgi:hypothetical protein
MILLSDLDGVLVLCHIKATVKTMNGATSSIHCTLDY